MADLKNMLKDARKHIDDGNFKEAQECCKNILRADKQNYYGLVLLGKSLQDSDQAPLAYQKAITKNRDKPLAWLGLAQYYEGKRDDDSKQKLLRIYNEMLYLQMDDKTQYIINKVGNLGVALRSRKAIHILAEYITKIQAEKWKKLAETQLVEVLKVDSLCDFKDIPAIMEILSKVHANEPSDSLEMLQCRVILQKSDLNTALEDLLVLDFFRKKDSIKEMVCQWLCAKFIETMTFGSLDLNKLETITEGIKSSKYADLLNKMLSYEKGLYVEAYEPLINFNEANVTEATFILKCNIMLKQWPVVQKLATKFITKAKDESFLMELRKCLFYSLVKQQKWKQAIANAQLIPATELNDEEQACLTECLIETGESAEHIMENLKTTQYYTQLVALSYLKQAKYDELVSLLQEPADNALLNFYLGKAFWVLKQYSECIIYLLKAAKLNPDHAETFLYLGYYYYNQKNDEVEAKKCYEKAYSLNNTDENIVKSLSLLYIDLKQFDLNYELLTTFTRNVTYVEAWVYKTLGLHYLNNRDWARAITNFQNVLKQNKNDALAYECLADAYYSRGSYTSSRRAYNKAMSLDPTRATYCLTNIGCILSLFTEYKEAITIFEKVIKSEPTSLLALKGIAETWLSLAKKKLKAHLYGSARDCAQHAMDYAWEAIKSHNKYTCLWKLVADTIVFVVDNLPAKYAHLVTLNLSNQNDFEPVKKGKMEMILQAIYCYEHIAQQRQQASTYQLVYTNFLYYKETKDVLYEQKAVDLAVIGVTHKPKSWSNWNLLGHIYLVLNKYEKARQCFIEALRFTKNNSAAKVWCNLGALYLKLKLFKKANYCFSRGQSAEPRNCHSWIGQALIAEQIREEEAMDLFRHATTLGYHPESALGYADWVCRTLYKSTLISDSEFQYNIYKLNAIPNAMDLLEWFLTYDPNHACANNMLGLLQEETGLIKPALRSYERALKYSEDKEKSIILLNIGRILTILEKYEEAIKIFQAIPEASFESTVGLALALFKKRLYEESYAAYETALYRLCIDEHDKLEVHVAMARIRYITNGPNVAKTVLLQSIQAPHTKPSPNALLAICSLGIIHSELSISKFALYKLKKYETESEFACDIGFLRSYCYVCEGDFQQGINILAVTAGNNLDNPGNGLMWLYTAQYWLRKDNKLRSNLMMRAKEASYTARKALSSSKLSAENSVKVYATASIAEHISGNATEALRLAKMGLHLYPNRAEIWAALLFTLKPKNYMEKNWLIAAARHMRRNLTISRPLDKWVRLMEKKIIRNVKAKAKKSLMR